MVCCRVRNVIACMVLLYMPIMAKYVNLESKEQFNRDVLGAQGPAVVKFAATWCHACQMVKTPFEEVAQEGEFGSILFVNIDIDQYKDLAEEYKVAGIPTIVYLQNKEIKKQSVGIEIKTP